MVRNRSGHYDETLSSLCWFCKCAWGHLSAAVAVTFLFISCTLDHDWRLTAITTNPPSSAQLSSWHVCSSLFHSAFSTGLAKPLMIQELWRQRGTKVTKRPRGCLTSNDLWLEQWHHQVLTKSCLEPKKKKKKSSVQSCHDNVQWHRPLSRNGWKKVIGTPQRRWLISGTDSYRPYLKARRPINLCHPLHCHSKSSTLDLNLFS